MLNAESVSRSYGRVVALPPVSLRLEAGARLGLVGPSGAGKSTLARVLAALEPPDGGEVVVDGARIRTWGVRLPRAARHRVQLVFQSPRLAVDPRLRVGEAILEPLRSRDDALLAEWAERVGLTRDLLSRYPNEVSEGQLQRACLARALIVRPRYLICDELSSMLDVSTQAALLETIAGVDGLGVLLITHDRVLADSWCDAVVDIATLAA
jgi:peptide/nickel transport system ATP-binding protein